MAVVVPSFPERMIAAWILVLWGIGGLMYIAGLLYLSNRHITPIKSRALPGDAPPNTSNAIPKLTVLIPLRNEVKGLRKRLEHWLLLAEENPDWSFLVVDDHSTDGTRDLLENAALPTQFKLLTASCSGKIGCWQAALTDNPLSNYYLLMDADVTPHGSNIQSVLSEMDSRQAHVAMLPLGVNRGNFRANFEALEFAALHGIGQRLMRRGIPILFSSAFTLVEGGFFQQFLQWAARERDHRSAAGPDARWITYLSSNSHRVYSGIPQPPDDQVAGLGAVPAYGLMPAQRSTADWLKQRARWASQAFGAPRNGSLWLQLAVIAGVVCAQTSLFLAALAPVLAALWVGKTLAEWRFFKTLPDVVSPRVPLHSFFVYSLLFSLLLPVAAGYALLRAGRRSEGRWR